MSVWHTFVHSGCVLVAVLLQFYLFVYTFGETFYFRTCRNPARAAKVTELTTKIEELTSAISEKEATLKKATALRKKESAAGGQSSEETARSGHALPSVRLLTRAVVNT